MKSARARYRRAARQRDTPYNKDTVCCWRRAKRGVYARAYAIQQTRAARPRVERERGTNADAATRAALRAKGGDIYYLLFHYVKYFIYYYYCQYYYFGIILLLLLSINNNTIKLS